MAIGFFDLVHLSFVFCHQHADAAHPAGFFTDPEKIQLTIDFMPAIRLGVEIKIILEVGMLFQVPVAVCSVKIRIDLGHGGVAEGLQRKFIGMIRPGSAAR